jgi:TonB family protein
VPRRIVAVEPVVPAHVTAGSASVIVELIATVDANGRVVEVQGLNVTTLGRRLGSPSDPSQWTEAEVKAEEAIVKETGEAFMNAAADAVRQWLYEPPIDAPIAIHVVFEFAPGQAPRLMAHSGWPVGAPVFRMVPPPPPSTQATSRTVWTADAIRVGQNITPPTKVKHVNPVYPPLAQSAKVQGVVIIEALIGPDGTVADARVLRSIPLLDQAALDAVRQWEFTPTLLNGQPVPIIMTMTVQFALT